jgi:hypothetical protein
VIDRPLLLFSWERRRRGERANYGRNSIVAALDAMDAETQRLASLYERKIAALEALKKSLLHQAFSGTL